MSVNHLANITAEKKDDWLGHVRYKETGWPLYLTKERDEDKAESAKQKKRVQ